MPPHTAMLTEKKEKDLSQIWEKASQKKSEVAIQ
jgi:hypothetical protein